MTSTSRAEHALNRPVHTTQRVVALVVALKGLVGLHDGRVQSRKLLLYFGVIAQPLAQLHTFSERVVLRPPPVPLPL